MGGIGKSKGARRRRESPGGPLFRLQEVKQGLGCSEGLVWGPDRVGLPGLERRGGFFLRQIPGQGPKQMDFIRQGQGLLEPVQLLLRAVCSRRSGALRLGRARGGIFNRCAEHDKLCRPRRQVIREHDFKKVGGRDHNLQAVGLHRASEGEDRPSQRQAPPTEPRPLVAGAGCPPQACRDSERLQFRGLTGRHNSTSMGVARDDIPGAPCRPRGAEMRVQLEGFPPPVGSPPTVVLEERPGRAVDRPGRVAERPGGVAERGRNRRNARIPLTPLDPS
jgi:hypothetical protein